MDERDIELVQTGLEIFSDHLGPEYDRIHRDINDTLVGDRIHDHYAQVEAERLNVNLVTEIVHTLPPYIHSTYDHRQRTFATASWSEFRILQNSVIWYYENRESGSRGKALMAVPMYVIGRKEVGPYSELMLAEVSDSSNKWPLSYIQAAQVKTKRLKRAEEISGRLLTQEMSESDITAYYSPEDNKFYLGNLALGNINMAPGLKLVKPIIRFRHKIGFSLLADSKDTLPPKNQIIKAQEIGYYSSGLRSSKGLSEQTMAQFSVMDYLIKLATTFGRVDEVQNVLEQHKLKLVEMSS